MRLRRAAAARICVFNGDGSPTEGRAPENADRPTAGARKRLPLPIPPMARRCVPFDGLVRG